MGLGSRRLHEVSACHATGAHLAGMHIVAVLCSPPASRPASSSRPGPAGIILFMSVLLSIGVRESALFITSRADHKRAAVRAQQGAGLHAPIRPPRARQMGLVMPAKVHRTACTPSCALPTHGGRPPAGVTAVKLILIVFVAVVGYTRGTVATLYDPPTAPYVYNPEYGAANPAFTPLIKGPTQPFFHPVGRAARTDCTALHSTAQTAAR